MNSRDAILAVLTRNAFYRRLHYLALCALIATIFVIAFLVGMLIYLSRNPTHPIYFATDNVGRLIHIIPTDQPNLSNEDVLSWAGEAVEAAFSMDYVNYRMQMQSAQKYFTSYGWTNYLKAVEVANNISALTTRKMVVTAKMVGQPTIVPGGEGLLAGSYAWKIEIPMLVTYSTPPYDEASKYHNALTVTVVIQRQPILQSYKGLGIAQLIGSFAEAPLSQPQQITNTPTG